MCAVTHGVWMDQSGFLLHVLVTHYSHKGFTADLQTLTCFIKVEGMGRELLIRSGVI